MTYILQRIFSQNAATQSDSKSVCWVLTNQGANQGPDLPAKAAAKSNTDFAENMSA